MSCRLSTFLTGTLIAAASCGVNAQGLSSDTKAWCARVVPMLRETLREEPREQAAKAASLSNLRYLEWYGIASAIPGVKSQSCVREHRLSRPFEGTSDALCSQEHRELYERSYAYAEVPWDRA